MQRVSTKHGALLDDEMARETRGTVQGTAGGRAQEWKTPEPAGEDQPEVTRTPSGDWGRDVPAGVGSAEGEAFSRFGTWIGRAFPGDREALERSARGLEAPDDVLQRLATLPDGRVYENAAQAWDASEGRNA